MAQNSGARNSELEPCIQERGDGPELRSEELRIGSLYIGEAEVERKGGRKMRDTQSFTLVCKEGTSVSRGFTEA